MLLLLILFVIIVIVDYYDVNVLYWRSMVTAVCVVQLEREVGKDLVGLNRTIDQLATASIVCWYDHVLGRGIRT